MLGTAQVTHVDTRTIPVWAVQMFSPHPVTPELPLSSCRLGLSWQTSQAEQNLDPQDFLGDKGDLQVPGGTCPAGLAMP